MSKNKLALVAFFLIAMFASFYVGSVYQRKQDITDVARKLTPQCFGQLSGHY